MCHFSISSTDPSNTFRSPQFPILEAGNISFPEGRYTVQIEVMQETNSLKVSHQIEGAPLISRLLKENKALYVCIVSSPKSSYRETFRSDTREQSIVLNDDDFGESPLLTPMIVYSGSRRDYVMNRVNDGVSQIWHGQTVVLEKGSRLVIGQNIQFQLSSILGLMKFIKEEDMGEGEFKVGITSEGNFRFRIAVAPDLHAKLQIVGNSARAHIMTNVVTACLAYLQRHHSSENGVDHELQSDRNLRALTDYLEKNNIDHWTDEGFSPEHAATKLYPHKFPKESEHE